MLPKVNRLKKEKDFQSVFKKGEGVKEDFLILKKGKNSLECSRFGFVVGINISKKATLRNKIKRRLRYLVHKRLPKIKKGLDVILIAQPGLEDKDFIEIEKAIDRIFDKTKIIK